MTSQDQEALRARLERRDPGPSTQSASSPWATSGEGLHSVTGIPARGAALDEFGIPDLATLSKMRSAPMIALGLGFIVSSVSRAKWHVKSTDPRRAAFVENALRTVYPQLIAGWANALSFGYSALVLSYERRPVDWTFLNADEKERRVWTSSAPPLVWENIVPLNPRVARVHWSADGSFGGIDYRKPRTAFTDGEGPDIPTTHALWLVNERDAVFGSLYGFPRTSRAYRSWWSAMYRQRLSDRAMEKWADPPVIVRHPVDASTDADGNIRDYTSEALALAEQLRSGANVAMPSSMQTSEVDGRTSALYSWTIEQMKSEADFTAINTGAEYLDVQQLRALMIPEQALVEGKGGTSSRNVAETLGSAFEESMASLLHEVFTQVNRWMIPTLLSANFGEGATCEIIADGFDEADVETGRAIVQALAQNATSELSDVDTRSLLSSLGVPLRSAARAEEVRTRMKDEATKPASVNASEDEPTDDELREIELDAESLLFEAYEPPTKPRRTVTEFPRDATGRLVGTTEREVEDE